MFYIFIFIMYTSICQSMLLYVFRNLPRIWLLYQGSRFSIFSLIEKIYFSAAIAAALPVLIVHLLLCFTLPQVFFDPLFAVMLFTFGMLSLLGMFYLSVIMYVYPRLGMSWANWMNMAISILALMVVFFAGFSWVEHRSEIITYSVIANVIALLIVLVLRLHAINIWPRVNFMRPVN